MSYVYKRPPGRFDAMSTQQGKAINVLKGESYEALQRQMISRNVMPDKLAAWIVEIFSSVYIEADKITVSTFRRLADIELFSEDGDPLSEILFPYIKEVYDTLINDAKIFLNNTNLKYLELELSYMDSFVMTFSIINVY